MTWLSRADDGTIRVRIKVVPGARHDQVSGLLGDRLKVRVSAPPEGGRANKAVCALLARTLKLKPADVAIEQGMTAPDKTARISGIDENAVRAILSDTRDH